MMKRYGIHVVGSFFLSALLPPRDGDEPSYYDVLGLDDSATDDELRKAYRKLSLKYHPDKIAQRGGDSKTKEKAAAEYEKIQEAYNVLIDEKKRFKYDALETPTRYRFVEQGGFANPQALHDNLANSSFNDKSRLVGLFFFAILLVLMQPILIAAKVNQTLGGGGPLEASSWVSILVPYWLIGGLIIVVTFVAAVFVPSRDRLLIFLSALEQLSWYIGVMFLCFKWDETWDDSVSYSETLAPIYIAMILRWTRSFLSLQKVRKDVNRMVTSDYIESEILKGRSMEDLSEEEQDDLMKAFLVVTVDPDFEPHDEELTSEELEEEKVESSQEYEAATEIYNTIFYGLSRSLFFGIIFLILLTLKLDDQLNSGANWWAVFSPFWIEKGGRLAFSLYKCCCGGISGDEVVLYAGSDFPVDTEAGGSEDEKSKDEEIGGTLDEEDGEKRASSETKTNEESETNLSADDNKSKNSAVINDSNKEGENASNMGRTEREEKAESTSPTGENVGGDADDDSEEEIHVDADTYYAWQKAYQEAEKDTKQERAKSCTEACSLIFQIILLCLVVAKIEKNFDSVDTDDVGFNVFWILFPFFLFFGLSCCCCALLIFGVGPEPAGGETPEAEYDPENPPTTKTDEKQEGAINIPVDSKDEENAVETPIAPEKQIEESTPENSDPSNSPSDNNMDDLD